MFTRVAATLIPIALAVCALAAAAPALAVPTAAPVSPWAQPNGRVVAIARVGGVVYIGGQFTQVLDSDGTTVLPRNHLAAISAADGHVLPWNPGANGTVRALSVSTDGRTIYIGGAFTTLGGVARQRLAAEAAVSPTSSSTGTLLGWAPRADDGVSALVPLNGRVYLGGAFLRVNGSGRPRLAAVNAVTGALAAWKPRADGVVNALLASPNGSRLFVGGSFKHLDGKAAARIGALNPTSGKLLRWASHPKGRVWSLAENASMVFAGDGGGGGHVRAFTMSTGRLRWTNSSDGDVVTVGILGRGSAQRVIAGGHFNKFGSYTRPKVAALSPTTGLVDPTWSPYATGSILGVHDLLTYGQHTYFGGDFTGWAHTGAGPVAQAHLADFPSADPVDTTPPVVHGPTVRFPAGASVGTRLVPLSVGWSASDAGSGVCRYLLQRDYNAGAYSPIALRYATATSATTSASPAARPYGFRVQATDCSDNASADVAGPAALLAAYQNSSRLIRWSGSWTGVRMPLAYGGSVRRTRRAGASASLRFTGHAFAWVGSLGPGYGSARITIDGRTAGIVHLHAATTRRRVIPFAKSWPANGTHTVRIVALGTAGHPLVDLDALLTIR